MESVTRPILSGLPLQLRWAPFRASCESEIGAGGLDDLLIILVECIGGKSGPLGRAVEDIVNRTHEGHGLGQFIPARLRVIMGNLYGV